MKEVAQRALSLLDLTSLNDNDTEETVVALCAKAHGDFGKTAAVCTMILVYGIAMIIRSFPCLTACLILHNKCCG